MEAAWPTQILLKCVNSKKDAKKQVCGFKKKREDLFYFVNRKATKEDSYFNYKIIINT
jgi:hypothetical protein